MLSKFGLENVFVQPTIDICYVVVCWATCQAGVPSRSFGFEKESEGPPEKIGVGAFVLKVSKAVWAWASFV